MSEQRSSSGAGLGKLPPRPQVNGKVNIHQHHNPNLTIVLPTHNSNHSRNNLQALTVHQSLHLMNHAHNSIPMNTNLLCQLLLRWRLLRGRMFFVGIQNGNENNTTIGFKPHVGAIGEDVEKSTDF
uniref:Uncharacterized protein n=1 Tax=Opuntia streptacantha TaxID=393608 RepID=A0A7C9CVU8_OPUST